MTKLIIGTILTGALSLARCGDDGAETPDSLDATDTVDTADSAPVDTHGDVAETDGGGPPACLGPTAGGQGTDRLTHALGVASVTIDDRTSCTRTYRLASTATRRDDLPSSPRTIVERATDPVVRTGHDLFDALHALAIDEAHDNEVDTITDGAFGGAATPCGGDAGCYETGRKWTYVWTRDTAYAVDLGLAAIDPARAAGSLRFKLSPLRDGDGLHIVQDTGSGGSYPVSTDRVVWALGARQVLLQLEGAARTAFRDAAFEALVATLEHDRQVAFDSATGLYRGETSFLDWREQTYAGWTQNDVIDIATGAALGTNVLHLHALGLLAELCDELEDPRAERYRGWAEALRTKIHERMWHDDAGLFASFVPSALDPAPVRRFDALGLSLAVLHEVATPAEATRILSSYPHYGPGVPVIWPQQQFTAIYHNRAAWPFVDAYWLRAAQHARHDAATDRMVRSLMRGAALNLSNMENFEAGSGSPWLVDGNVSGPVVNSQRQLWSVAGYLSMVHRSIFGVESTATGVRVTPWITHALRRELFTSTDELVLNNMLHRNKRLTIVVTLPPLSAPALPGGGGALRVASRAVDGVPWDGGGDVIPEARLGAHTRIDVVLEHDPDVPAATLHDADPTDWQAIFGPRTPQVKAIELVSGELQLTLGPGDEATDGLTFTVYRDGEVVADALPGTTTTWVDANADPARSPCYTVESTFTATGNRSQHARARCWWGADSEAIQVIQASAFEAVGGTGVTEYGRFHYRDWGDPGHTLTVRGITPTRTGPHLVQLGYGNGAGPINTGIACGVKRVTVIDEQTTDPVADAVVVMPQLGTWDRWALSSFVPVELDQARTYTVIIASDATTLNMSALSHFTTYTGTGGRDGPMSRVNISELRLLAR